MVQNKKSNEREQNDISAGSPAIFSGSKKLISTIILTVVMTAQSLTNWVLFGSTQTVHAAGPIEENKLVAMFVQDSIYKNIKTSLERYNLTYIQSRFPKTKVLVFPVDTTSIRPLDISKILSNLFHEGEKDTPSTLIGTILVGNVPLPIIKQDSFIVPSMLPYTDITKPTYVYDATSQYFIPSTYPTDNKQELFHSIIRFDTSEQYNNYFTKLKTYAANPKGFADKKFWFDDFSKLTETLTEPNIPLYLKSQIHTEDLSYHRFSAGLFNMLKDGTNDDALSVLQSAGDTSIAQSSDYDAQSPENVAYSKALSDRGSSLAKQGQDGKAALASLGQGDKVPTLVLGQSTVQQVKPYPDLFSAEYGDFIKKNIDSIGRWEDTDVTTHITKVATFDEVSTTQLQQFNKAMEEKLDKQATDNKRALRMPIPVAREKRKCVAGVPLPIPAPSKYEAFYFGKNGFDITSALDTTRYRGYFQNIENPLTINALPRTNDTRSVGASLGFTAQQVIASRGYNPMNTQKDADAYSDKWRKVCGNRKNANIKFETYIRYFYGGHTPVNIDGDTNTLKTDEPQYAFNPLYDKSIGGPLFDIAGSQLAPSEATPGYDARSVTAYGNLLKVAPGHIPLFGTDNAPWCDSKEVEPVSQHDFFSAVNDGSKITRVVNSVQEYKDDATVRCKEILFYKTIDSTVKHTSPTPEEIAAMNIATKDRPIDVHRYISFQGLGGSVVRLDYPNVYDVPVYKKQGNSLTLMSQDEIKQSIKTYLQNRITDYNTALTAQNAAIPAYVTAHPAGRSKLQQKDPLATPIGRTYQALPTDFFVQLLGDDAINRIAETLSLRNSPWPTRVSQSTVGATINSMMDSANIANKVREVMAHQITEDKSMIGKTATGYEAGYIRSYDNDSITSTIDIPSKILRVDTAKSSPSQKTAAVTSAVDRSQQASDAACGVAQDATVPLLKWPKALKCWYQQLKKITAGDVVKISFKNAQGPVFTIDQLKSSVTEQYQDYAAYVQETLGKSSLESQDISSAKLDLVTQKVIRGAQIPVAFTVTNKAGEKLENLVLPFEVSVDGGAEFFVPGQATPVLQTTTPSDPLILSTENMPAGTQKLHVTLRGPIDPTSSGVAFTETKEIIVVPGTLRTQFNGTEATDATIALTSSGYTQKIAGVTSINTNTLPTLGLRLTDNNSQPITSLATVTSMYGLVQPCRLQEKTEQSITTTQCVAQNERTLNGGAADIRLLPSMKAGTDTLTIQVPGLPDRTIQVIVLPAPAYRVSVINNDASRPTTPTTRDISTRFIVQDVRGNTIPGEHKLKYSLIGDINPAQGTDKDGVLTTTGASTRFVYGDKGGVSYIYAALADAQETAQEPGYLRTRTPSRIWPMYNMNVVYMTLDGKDRGNPSTTQQADMIASSPKLISLNTRLFDPQNTYPVVALFDTNGVALTQGNIGSDVTTTTGTGSGVLPEVSIVGGKRLFAKTTSASKPRDTLIQRGGITIARVPAGAAFRPENIIIENPGYKAVWSWTAGSSNAKATAIVSITSDTFDDTFAHDFTSLRSYAGGATVAQSQMNVYTPETVIYGDAFLQHADATKPIAGEQTTVTLYQDDSKTIQKVMELDIDKDSKKDMVVLYDDDTIRFLKNYGGMQPYTQLGNLMSVVDGVQQMWIGDADGNGLEDIYIKTKKNTLRVYLNKGGMFDVNGQPICLDVPSGDTSLAGVYQLFIADMNHDANSDIITNDIRGRVRIFYGGESGKGKSAGPNYISTNPYSCDAQRQTRQAGHVYNVVTFGVQLTDKPIYDDALVHWKGLAMPPETPDDDAGDDTNETDTNPVLPAGLQNAIPTPDNPTAIDISALVNAGIQDTVRYNATPYDRLPSYESQDLEQIAYIPSRYLTGSDPVRSYKTFAAGPDSTIIVTVHLTSTTSTKATYIEQLRGPWDIALSETGAIEGFNRGTLNSSAVIDWQVDNGFQFAIDNIDLVAGTKTFSYPIKYKPTQLVSIDVLDVAPSSNKGEATGSPDGWLDIATTPTDSCMSSRIAYMSQQGVAYPATKIDLPDTTQAQYASGEAEIGKNLSDVNNIISAAKDGTATDIPMLKEALEQRDYSGNVMDKINSIVDGGVQVNLNGSVDLSFPNVEAKIDGVLKGLCEGFGGGKGNLPVPFNVAFLAPGTINVMGCKVANDKGLPVFHFPGTLQTPSGPVPMPRGQKGPGDGFYWAAGGVYPSQIRLYVAPTLTMSMGFAVCFGPYAAGIKLPSPLKHIAGNCIVFGKRPGKKSKDKPAPAGYNPADPISAFPTNTNTCRTIAPDPMNNRPISPLDFTARSGKWDRDITSSAGQTAQQSPQSNIQPGTYLGILDIDSVPYATQKGQDSVDKEKIKGGSPIKLKIEGGNVKGLVKCVIQKWLDNQIRYVINNLTSMSINVTLPDVAQLSQGFQNLNFQELGAVADNFKKDGNTKTPAGTVLNNLVTKTKGENQKGIASPVGKSDISELGSVINNPIDTLSSWFEQVPLIRVNTKNVNIQVPFIYNEELTRYTAQLNAFVKDADKKIQDWKKLGENLTGLCNKEKNASDRAACNEQVKQYADVALKTQQLQSSIRKNLVTLKAYKNFPLELQQRLTVGQRYMTEATDTVQGVSRDITSWMNVNAKRFEAYTDAIILMVTAIKSWQALIDFSVNWKSKCGKCTVDNYDYYSCALKLLCPKLPILAIPPFKLPNVYIDLSNIRLGLDIVLPKIHFTPQSIPLPALPTLPEPPQINVDLTATFNSQKGKFGLGGKGAIPSIPQLPAPPKLPELPSFIPSIELNLPTLPPAPRVPRLSPAISTTLKVVGTVAKILCIVKSGIGLVGEKGVKTRIEQMTQRSWNVAPFDMLSITRIKPPLKGFDIKVSTYVDFQLNFEGLFTVLDELAGKINKQTNKLMQGVNKAGNKVSSMSADATSAAQNTVDKGNINIQGFDTSSIGDTLLGYNTAHARSTQIDTTSEEKEAPTISATDDWTTTADALRKGLTDQIAVFKHSEAGEHYQTQIATMEGMLAASPTITPLYDNVSRATQGIQNMFAASSQQLEKHKKALNDYDAFLDHLQTDMLISDEGVNDTINVQLFDTTPTVHNILKTSEHPLRSYLGLQKEVVDGFKNALDTRGPDELEMDIFAYNKLRTFFHQTHDVLAETLDAIPEKNDTAATASATLATDHITTPTTQNLRPQAARTVVPVVHAESITPPPPSTTLGAIRWDTHSIMTNQQTFRAVSDSKTRYTRYYEFPTIRSYADLAQQTDNAGYIKSYNSLFYVYNISTALTSYNADGQSNDTVSVRWKNAGHSVYFIKLDKRIQAQHEYIPHNAAGRSYVIAYASGVNLDNMIFTLPDEPQKKVSELITQGIVYKTIAFDPSASDITLSIPLAGNLRSYTSIMPIVVNTNDNGTQYLHSVAPRSILETLGVQRRGDTTPPVAQARLVDRKDGIVIAEGNNMQVPRHGAYDLIVTWTDDGIVVNNTIQQLNKGLPRNVPGSEGKMSDIPTENNLQIYATATDQSNNIGNQNITITYTDPTIDITRVDQQYDERAIISNISQLYPEGYVKFYSAQNKQVTMLTGVQDKTPLSAFPTFDNTTEVTGQVFYDADTISLFSPDQKRIARIEKKSGKIIVTPEWKSRIQFILDTTQNIPRTLIIDTTTKQTLFSLYMRTSKLLNIAPRGSAASVTPMAADTIGTFAGGQCIRDTQNTCVIYLTTNGDMFIPDAQKGRVGGVYSFDSAATYTFTIDGTAAVDIRFIPSPLGQ